MFRRIACYCCALTVLAWFTGCQTQMMNDDSGMNRPAEMAWVVVPASQTAPPADDALARLAMADGPDRQAMIQQLLDDLLSAEMNKRADQAQKRLADRLPAEARRWMTASGDELVLLPVTNAGGGQQYNPMERGVLKAKRWVRELTYQAHDMVWSPVKLILD